MALTELEQASETLKKAQNITDEIGILEELRSASIKDEVLRQTYSRMIKEARAKRHLLMESIRYVELKTFASVNKNIFNRRKIQRGLNEVQEGQSLNNSQRIIYEFNDLLSVMEVLLEEGVFTGLFDRQAMDLKKVKIEKYLRYSKECGSLKE